MRLPYHLFLVIGMLNMPATSQASLLPNSCLTDLDEATTLFNNGNSKRAAALLKVLQNSCSHLPQVHHNLGVIAGVRQQWQQALSLIHI